MPILETTISEVNREIARLRSELRDAEARSDRSESTRIVMLLLYLLLQTKYTQQIRSIVRSYSSRITPLVIDGDAVQVSRIMELLREMHQRVSEEMAGALDQLLIDIWPMLAKYIVQPTPGMLRSALSVPVDDEGNIIPPPVVRLPLPIDGNPDFERAVLAASGYLMLKGFRDYSDRAKLEALPPTPDATRRNRILHRNPLTGEITAPWVGRVNGVFSSLSLEQRINALVFSGRGQAEILREIRKLIGDVSSEQLRNLPANAPRPYSQRIQQEFTHEGWDIFHESLDTVLDDELGEAYIGYTLLSRFWPTTDPVHAANSGNRYYRDNRLESAAPWSERLWPPYRKNCVCYVEPIFDEFGPDPTAGTNGLPPDPDFLIRDDARFAQFFNIQTPAARSALVGDELYGAVAEKTQSPQHAHFLNDDLRYMTVSQQQSESAQSFAARTARVQQLIRERELRSSAGWAALGVVASATDSREMRLQMRNKLS